MFHLLERTIIGSFLILCSFTSIHTVSANTPNAISTIQKQLNKLALLLDKNQFTGFQVSVEDLPVPYNYLLIQPLMTAGIEQYYHRTALIKPVHAQRNNKNNTYSRVIYMILDREQSNVRSNEKHKNREQLIVELAFITINFNELPTEVINDILKTNIPFGKILQKYKLKTYSVGRSYFSLICTPDLVKLVYCRKNHLIYGRTNTLIREDNRKWIARVLEILPGLKCSNKECSTILYN